MEQPGLSLLEQDLAKLIVQTLKLKTRSVRSITTCLTLSRATRRTRNLKHLQSRYGVTIRRIVSGSNGRR
ncbi:MAG: hypothetical protein HP490_00305 [Nitrospira sp.]|nr:hypothetical protein [Nitrospira sp.]